MPQILPGFANVAIHIKHDLDEDPFVVTYGALVPEGGDPVNLANGHKQAFYTAWSSSLTTLAVVQKAVMTIGQTPPAAPVIVESITSPSRGSSGTAKLPQNCALLIQKKTSFGGRRFRGRMYMPSFVSETNVDEAGVIASATVTGFQTAANNWLQALADGGPTLSSGAMFLLHSASPTTGSPIPVPTAVTKLQVSPVIATQRRRLRR